jgi:hypothetical protein
VISGFRRDVDEICALLAYYTALNGNPLLVFLESVLVPSSRVKMSKKKKASKKIHGYTGKVWVVTGSK